MRRRSRGRDSGEGRSAHLVRDRAYALQRKERLARVRGAAHALVEVEVEELRDDDEVLAPVEEVEEAHDARRVARVRAVDELEQLDLVQRLVEKVLVGANDLRMT